MMTSLITLRLRLEQDVVLARQRSRELAALLMFDSQDQTRIATAVSEIARNALRYANGGSVEFRMSKDVLEIRITDQGPGIENVKAVLQGRPQSTTGLGLGIAGARKLMDTFRIDTQPGRGTRVSMSKTLPPRSRNLTKSELDVIVDKLVRVSEDPFREMAVQNRELLQVLNVLRVRQQELTQLNRELEDTNRGVVALYTELDEKAEYLRHADQLKSTFLSHMSHEFRTPLNSILGLTKILVDRLDGPLTEEQEKQVNFIHKAARELTDLVNDLLDLAKVEAGKIEIHPSETDVATMLGALRGMMRPLCVNPNVQLTFDEVPSNVPTMISDEAKISQILRNFISNALKFTEQGEVRVRCEYHEDTEFVSFTVSDTGIGIPSEEQERIFLQYYQLRNAVTRRIKGTGLGLPLSKKLADLLGGSITLTSEPGVGSEFTVRLPARYVALPTPETEAQRPDTPSSPPGIRKVPRILVIEDEQLTRYLIRKQLAAIPAEVEEAKDAQEGLQRVGGGGIDLIVLDLVLPDVSGFEILARLKQSAAAQNIPIVIYTSLSLGNQDRASLSTAAAIVTKDRSELELRDVVRSLTKRP